MLSFEKLLALSPMFFAVVAGIAAYRHLNWFYRLLLLQVILYVPTDLYAASLVPHNHNNSWVYNISMMIEIPLILAASMMYFKTKTARLILSILFVVFCITYCVDMYIIKNETLYVHAYLCGGIFITGAYLFILFFHFFERKDQYQSLPLVLTCLGIALYFSCMAPYLSMMDQLQAKDQDTNKNLFLLIIGPLDKVRYFLTAFAFLLHWKRWRMNSSY